MEVVFPCPGYEGIAPAQVPDANLLGAFAPRALGGIDTDAMLTRAFAEPIGAPPLREVLKTTDRVLVLIDDGTRGTPVPDLLAPVAAELNAAGVRDAQVTLLTSPATHRAMLAGELRSANPTIHGVLNATALCCFVWSWFARRRGDRETGIGLSVSGLALTTVAAFLGGELVYRQGTGVNRNAFNPETDEWGVAAKVDDLKDGELSAGEITVHGRGLPLVLLKRGERIQALSGVCAHWGGPLAEGKLIDGENGECVECPWHGSRFSLRDGAGRRGPATVDQPRFEVRIREGNVEARRLPDEHHQ